MLPDDQVERVLVVTAHPDDVDFGSAGTIAQWTKAGIEVAYCIITDGDSGGFDPEVARSEIPRIRRAEQRAAAETIGVQDVTFLGYPDGRLSVTFELRRDISRQIRRVRPQRVVTSTPRRNFERIGVSHPDHMAAGEATLCAVYPDARNPFAHPELLRDEGLADWKVAEVWLSGDPEPTHHVDVTDTFDAKLAAIRAHVSQLPMVDDLEGTVGGWLRRNAAARGLPEGRLAETFAVLQTL